MWKLLALDNLSCDAWLFLYILRTHVFLYNLKERGVGLV